MLRNYWKLKANPLTVVYAYVDGTPSLGERLLMEEGLRVEQRSEKWSVGSDCRIAFCRVKRTDERKKR